MEILRRAGYSKEALIDALRWVAETSKMAGAVSLFSHPGTSAHPKEFSRHIGIPLDMAVALLQDISGVIR